MQARIRFRVAGGEAPPDWGQQPVDNGSFELRADDPTKLLYELTGWALEHGSTFETLEVTRPSLEDVYIEYTGGEEGAE
jgi:hypothetical protein